jgi:hypothetical protein
VINLYEKNEKLMIKTYSANKDEKLEGKRFDSHFSKDKLLKFLDASAEEIKLFVNKVNSNLQALNRDELNDEDDEKIYEESLHFCKRLKEL